MATKKKPSKKQLQVKVPVFNKENAKAFADMIFSDKGGVVSFLKLCDGKLVNGKDGGRTTHCAIGEAYHMFVNPDVRKLEKQTDEGYQSKYSAEFQELMNSEGPTARAIDALVDAAQLKKNVNKQDFASALDSCVGSNDDCDGDGTCSTTTFFTRAEQVADTWLNEVVPLLK
jgi:hypothetical protein